MSKRIDSFILPDDIIKEMKDKIKETKKKKIELGFALCTERDKKEKDKKERDKKERDKKERDNNVIIKGSECVGTQCSIKTGECKSDQIYVGNYHIHPRGTASLSIADMITGCLEDVECVGSVSFNNTRCFVRKTDKNRCYSEVIPFEKEEHEIVERSIKVTSAIKNPVQIIRMGVSQFIREFKQHDKEIGKYHTNRLRLLNKNFNRIDI